MGGFSFNIKKFARSTDASYNAQTLSNICVRKVGTVFPHIRPVGIFFNGFHSKVTVHKAKGTFFLGIIRMLVLFEGRSYLKKG